jgi:glycosyltransferase involved in cell wall biosynthesis
MRVLHLLNHTKRLNGNVHAAIDLACAEARLGHRVAIASGEGHFDDILTAHDVEIIPLTQERRVGALLKAAAKLQRLLRDWRPDVVHSHMMTSTVLAWPVCQLMRVPLVTTVHNAFERGAILMGLGTRVIAVSAAVGRSMQQRGIPKSRLSVVLNGTIGSARFEGKDRTPRSLDHPAILFVGGQHPRKGLADLFAAFDVVHKRCPAARLYIVGEGPFLETYVNQVKAMPCADAVHFMGAQFDPFPYLAGADVFVLPSLADPAPLVLSEAREAGCAVVGTEVDGIPELLEHGKAGLLVPPADPARLAEALCSLVENPDSLRTWKANSQFNIGYLRIERVARETLQVYAAASRRVRGMRSVEA